MPTTPAAPVGPTVFLLHRWNAHVDETGLFRSYAAALAKLASAVRTEWADVAHRADVPDAPDGLGDAEAVMAFYGGDGGTGGREAPMAGESLDAGFEIVEEPVAGPEPVEVTLRLASLRVLDGDPSDPHAPVVTYWLDAAALTVAVYAGLDGNPYVLITPQDHLSGTPVTVRLENRFGPAGSSRPTDGSDPVPPTAAAAVPRPQRG
jgi:hypothetical protein